MHIFQITHFLEFSLCRVIELTFHNMMLIVMIQLVLGPPPIGHCTFYFTLRPNDSGSLEINQVKNLASMFKLGV